MLRQHAVRARAISAMLDDMAQALAPPNNMNDRRAVEDMNHLRHALDMARGDNPISAAMISQYELRIRSGQDPHARGGFMAEFQHAHEIVDAQNAASAQPPLAD